MSIEGKIHSTNFGETPIELRGVLLSTLSRTNGLAPVPGIQG